MEANQLVQSCLLLLIESPQPDKTMSMSLMQFRLNRMILGPYLTILGTFLGPLGDPNGLVWSILSGITRDHQ